jgi:glycosyltransferase involved in cell wall biosynthesis
VVIFITIPWFRPAFRAGGPIQSIDNLVSNRIKGVQYKIFCANTDLNGEQINILELNTWLSYNDFTEVFYATKNNCTKNLTTQIQSIKPDTIFIIGLFSWAFNLFPLFFLSGFKKIISVRGMLHPGALSQKKTKKFFFIKFLQFFSIFKKFNFHATNENEAGVIKTIFGKNANVYVANNIAKNIEYQKPIQKFEHSLTLVTIALISPMKNHLLVLKALAKCKYNIVYNIYGPVKDVAYWQLCKNEIKLLPNNIVVNYKGEINYDKVLNSLCNCHIFIMPSKSENYAHSIKESLQAGRPVITSHNTPWNNLLQNTAGQNVDSTENEILDAINFFAQMNTETYESFSKNAHEFAKLQNSNDALLHDYLTMYKS